MIKKYKKPHAHTLYAYTCYLERRRATAFSGFVFGHALDPSAVFRLGFGYGQHLTVAAGGHQKRFTAYRFLVEQPTHLKVEHDEKILNIIFEKKKLTKFHPIPPFRNTSSSKHQYLKIRVDGMKSLFTWSINSIESIT